MSVIEIVSGCCLIVTCIIIIIAVSLQSSKSSGLSSVIMGGGDGGVRGRAKDSDAKLARLTRLLAIVLAVVTLAVNVISLYINSAPTPPAA